MEYVSFWFYDQLSDILSFDDLRTLENNFNYPCYWPNLLENQGKKRRQLKLQIHPDAENVNLVVQYGLTWMNGRGKLSLQDMDDKYEKRYTHIRSIVVDGSDHFRNTQWESSGKLVDFLTATAPKTDSSCHFEFIKTSACFSRAQGDPKIPMKDLKDILFKVTLVSVRFSSISLDFTGIDCLEFFQRQVAHQRLKAIDLRRTWPEDTNGVLWSALRSGRIRILKVEKLDVVEIQLVEECLEYWRNCSDPVAVTIKRDWNATREQIARVLGTDRIVRHPQVGRRTMKIEVRLKVGDGILSNMLARFLDYWQIADQATSVSLHSSGSKTFKLR
ncbi:hypothetical protein QR680_006990 [Steinernema hermaphroditum]|uniref:Uncharacterized protein n=1 Tax=Steinernema hermaphroditum TaxID=289476 RepID=A0AA39HX59_9BILA|nr:hypothetical protein QR680_006990 [Steinernema hermaphroditum]